MIAVVARGRFRFFGLFRKGEEFVIAWDQVKVIGEDAVLVCFDRRRSREDPNILDIARKTSYTEKAGKMAKSSQKVLAF